MNNESSCYCCQVGQKFLARKVCPVCNHRFAGKGWGGIDAHWRSSHEEVMPYEEFWDGLCDKHHRSYVEDLQSDRKEEFEDFLFETNEHGSGKAKSYIRAIELLEHMLAIKAFDFEDCRSIYQVSDIDRLEALVSLVRQQQRDVRSKWVSEDIPQSYFAGGYCSAALGAYIRYLAEHSEEASLLRVFEHHDGSGSALAQKLDRGLLEPQRFFDPDAKGEDVVRTVTTRRNQNVFKKMMTTIYRGQCCISGLNIPEINRASHIVPWSQNKEARLDPSNGLLLSATYDAAFDRNLITLDEDFRVVVSKQIQDRYPTIQSQHIFQKLRVSK